MEQQTPAASRRRRPIGPRLALGVLLALAAVGAGHTLLWRAMAAELEAGFATWVQIRRAQGWRVDHAAPLRGGWPLAATLTLPNLRLEGGAATLPGGMTLQSERVVLRVALPRLDRLRVEMPGAQRLRIAGAEWRFAADTLVALLPLEQGTPPREGEVLAERLRLSSPAGPMSIGHARLSLATSTTATESEPALTMTVEANDIDLPSAPSGRAAAVRLFAERVGISKATRAHTTSPKRERERECSL
jgi:hypothetical protein